MLSSNKINKFLDYLNSDNSLEYRKHSHTDCIFHKFIRDVDLFFLKTSGKESIVVYKSIFLGSAFRWHYQNLKNVR